MTEIPEHLRKRAEEARKRSRVRNYESRFEQWAPGVPAHLEGVLRSHQEDSISGQEQPSTVKTQNVMPSSVKELVVRAQAAQDAAHDYAEIRHERENLYELIVHLHGSYTTLVNQETAAESKLEEMASLVAGWVDVSRPSPPELPDFPDRLTD